MLWRPPRFDWESVSVDQAYLFVGNGDTEYEDRSGARANRAKSGSGPASCVVGEVSSAADRGSDRETARVRAHGHDS